MGEKAGKICPFCQTVIHSGEPATRCSLCQMPHHPDCWQENGGCTTFGCPNSPAASGGGRRSTASQPMFTASGHIEITLEDLGLKCAGCGAELRDTDTICPACGTAATNPAASYGRTADGKKDPWAACLLNLIAGAGYFYLGMAERGLGVMVLSIVGGCMTYGIGYLIGVIYSMVDCYNIANRMNKGLPPS